MSRGFGRSFTFDHRDSDYMIRERLNGRPISPRRKFWWANGWWGDVEDKPWAVEYAWRAAICDGGGELDLEYGEFYKLCCEKETDGTGTTIRAGAKVLKDMGMIGDYHWCFDVEDVIATVLTTGPIVLGTDWYAAMNYPNHAGLLKVEGGKVGEHAVVINGIDLDKELVRVKNCWGRTWGKNGYGFLTFYGLDKLIWNNGDACYTNLSKNSFDSVEPARQKRRAEVQDRLADLRHSHSPSTEMAEAV